MAMAANCDKAQQRKDPRLAGKRCIPENRSPLSAQPLAPAPEGERAQRSRKAGCPELFCPT